MRKLAIICSTLSRGGAERVTVHLANYFASLGIPTVVINSFRYLELEEYELNSNVKRLCLSDRPRSVAKRQTVFNYIYSIVKLRRALKKEKADTVLIMGSPACIYAIPGALGPGRKLIVSERNAPEHFAGNKYVKYASRLLMRLADGLVFQTEDAKDYYRQRGYKEGAVIPNPLPSENLPIYEGDRECVIVTAGRLEAQKNTAMLIEAFSRIAERYPKYRLVIYGEGRLRGQLQEQIGALHLENQVCLAGNIPDVLEKIKSAGLFVLSSDFEGMPNALIEAMALGLPCISTDCPCGGPRELIEDGVNGLLVPVGDATATAEAIEKLLKDSVYANKLGKSARKIREKLNIERIGQMWVDYISKI